MAIIKITEVVVRMLKKPPCGQNTSVTQGREKKYILSFFLLSGDRDEAE